MLLPIRFADARDCTTYTDCYDNGNFCDFRKWNATRVPSTGLSANVPVLLLRKSNCGDSSVHISTTIQPNIHRCRSVHDAERQKTLNMAKAKAVSRVASLHTPHLAEKAEVI